MGGGGEFVEVLDSDSIPDKSIIKIRAITAEVSLAVILVFTSLVLPNRGPRPPTNAIKASAVVTSTSAGPSGLTQMRLTFS